MDISIIIVNWNTRELLKKCLGSIPQSTTNLKVETIVVDNASADGSAEMVKKYFPGVKLIANSKNTGYAFANNQGIKQSSGDFILLLNSDTEILPGSLPKMIDYLTARPRVGIAGCKLLNPDGTPQLSVRRFPTLWDQIVILTKLHNFFPELINNYLYLNFDYSREQEVDQVMGAFMLIRRAVVEQIGGLDQGTYFWFDDTDYCRRAKVAGWQITYTPAAEIIHLKGQSIGQKLAVPKQKMFVRSLLYYFRKHHGFLSYLILLPFALLSLILALGVQIFGINKRNKQL